MKSFNQYITEETSDANMKHILSNPPYNFEWVWNNLMIDAYNQTKLNPEHSVIFAHRKSSIGDLYVKTMLKKQYRLIIDYPVFYRTLPAFADITETIEHMLNNPMFTRDIITEAIWIDCELVNELNKFVYKDGTINKAFNMLNYYETLEGDDDKKLLKMLEFIKQNRMVNHFFSHLSIDQLILNTRVSIDKEFKPNMGDWANII